MKTNRFLFATLSAVMLFSASFLTSCEKEVEDLGAPSLKVSTTTLTFDADGKSTDEFGGTVEITANREWVVSIPESAQSWLTASVESGNGSGEVTFSMPASEESNSAKVAIQVLNDWGVALEEIVTVSQGEGSVGGATGEVIFNETVGTTVVQKDGNYYPYVTDYTEWNSTGMGASTVTFSGENTTVRSSGLASTGYEGASGINSIFFGTSPATFTVEKISLTSEQKDLNLVFGGSRYIYDTKDNTFVPESLVVSLSADGETWSTISYKVNKEEGESWVLCESNFSLKESASSLYIKFTCSEASVIRMDDIKLSEGTGGAEVDLGAGTVTPDPGTDPEVDDTDAIFYETVGTTAVEKEGNYYPYVSDYTEWNTTGTGAANVTFSGENTSVRTTSSHTSAGYDSASGVNNIFFASAPATFTVEKIALTSSQKNLNLSFGGSRYIYDTQDNTFVPENMVVSLSADGETWSTISYDVNTTTDSSWMFCEANFSLKEAASSLYIKFTCSEASVTRVDDIKLTEGKGGDSVDLGAGTVTPDPGTDPEVTPDADGDYVFDYEALGTSWLNGTEKTLGGVDWYIDGMKNSGDYGNIGFSYYNEVGGSCYNKTAFGTGVTEVIVDLKSGEALTVYAGASENPTEEVTPTVAGNIYTYAIPASCPYVAFKNNSTAYINLNALVINYEGTIGEGGTVTPDPGTDPEVTPDAGYEGTIYATDFSEENGAEAPNMTFGVYNFEWSKGENNLVPKYYTTGSSIRMYVGNTLTISTTDGSSITSVDFTFAGSTYDNLAASVGTYADGAWTGDATSIVFTTMQDETISGNEQSRIVSIVMNGVTGEDTTNQKVIAFDSSNNVGFPTEATATATTSSLDGVDFEVVNAYFSTNYTSYNIDKVNKADGYIRNTTAIENLTKVVAKTSNGHCNFVVCAGTSASAATTEVTPTQLGNDFIFEVPAGSEFVKLTHNGADYNAYCSSFEFVSTIE